MLMEKQVLIQEVANLIRSNLLSEAREKACLVHQADPQCLEMLILLNTIYRSMGDHESALQYSMETITSHPEYFDGYARAAQDLMQIGDNIKALAIINDGLLKNPDETWTLYTALLANVKNDNLQEAADLGLRLFSNDPNFVDAYEPLLYCLAKVGRADQAIDVIDKGLESNPANLHLVVLKSSLLARIGRILECKWFLYSELQHHVDRDRLRVLAESIYHLETREIQESRKATSFRGGCDVICIASDEAPYIHDFIHHYLYLGFANIFIGLNNCQDNTLSILEKIGKYYPQVHVLDVDTTIRDFKQWGCYHRIFNYAIQNSDSEYCLFVDIDEFWLADPFPKDINSFLEENKPFDVYSFYWVLAHSNQMFARPLDVNTTYSKSNWVKSLFSYSCPLSRIGVHGPIVDTLTPNKILLINGSPNTATSLTIHGLEVLGLNDHPYIINSDNRAWVIHAINRSEVEYAFRLFKVHANDDKGQVYFKTNRYGWDDPKLVDGKDCSYLCKAIPEEAASEYHQSLHAFILKCEIENELKAARSCISETVIYDKLDSLPFDMLMKESELLSRVFRGTKFCGVIASMLGASSKKN